MYEDIGQGAAEMGVAISGQHYDPKFVTDLITAEYRDFVEQLTKHKAEIGESVDGFLGGIAAALTEAGLAQTGAKSVAVAHQDKDYYGPQCPAPTTARCWEQWDCIE